MMRKATVRDILKLKIMEGCRVATGMSSLLNEIHYVNVYDNLPTDLDASIPVFPGDVYLSTLYYGKDDDNFVKEFIEKLISFKASALIVPDENMKVLPPEAISICNQAKFPVIFVDSKTPYSLIISEIMRYQLSFEHRETIEDKLHALVDAHRSSSEKEEITMQLNPNFQKHVVCFFYQRKGSSSSKILLDLEGNVKIANHLNRCPYNLAAEYRNGLLIIHSFSSARKASLSHDIDDIIEFIHQNDATVFMGISRIHDIDELGLAITEARTASVAGTINDNRLSYFRHIGVSRILTGLENSKTIEEFYSDVVSPIFEWDEKNNANLFTTMLTFVEQDMNYRTTANVLLIHENTVRYRMEKIKELIPYGTTEMDLYLTISLAAKIYKLKEI